MALEFRVLGPLEAVRSGSALRLGGRKQRSLLAAFVLHAGEFLSSDRLIDDLWGEEGESGATARLQVHISQLRKALGDDGELVETRPGGYVLSAPADAVDAHRFERLAAEGRVALACGEPVKAARQLKSGLRMWRGPALGDLAYEPVGERDAARLEEIRLVATEDLVEAHLALGRHREVVGDIERLVAEHPLRERLRAQLMLALYRSGRQADALAAHAAAREALAEQGLEPGPELERLQVAILRQDPLLLIEPEAPAVAPEAPAPVPAPPARAPLVERSDFLDTLAGALDQARTGRGVLVFLGGEAGVGKTSLVDRFAELHRTSARVLVGACEGSAAPRPLGPVFDILPELRDLAAGPDGSVLREELFERLQRELEREPSLVVIEDVHWADEATLDLLRHLGRRVSRLPSLVVATYRDDEVGRDHPLTMVLGDMASLPSTRRMALPRLSEHGVAVLAGGADVDVFELHRSTGGNAFFVTEVLAAQAGGGGDGAAVPATVRDAVLARAARCSPAARAALDAAAVVGGRVEPWLLRGLVDGDAAALDECVERGMLRYDDDMLSFRHELARRSIEEHVPVSRRQELHARILAALVEAGAGGDDAARLAHHAEAAGDARAVLTYAPAAARRAAQLGAHREAVHHYERARRFAEGLPDAERADLDERCAVECYLTDRIVEAIGARHEALARRRGLGDRPKVGENLRWLSRLSWYNGQNADAERYADLAVEELEGLPPGHELAFAYSNVSQLRMLAQRTEDAVEWGERAIAMAKELGDVDVLCHALNNVGTALMYSDRPDEGRPLLEESLRLGREARSDDHIPRAYSNLASGYIIQRRYAEADVWFGPALEYCEARDLDAIRLYMEGWQAASHLEQGRWEAALPLARSSLREPQIAPVSRVTGLIVLGLIAARRGTGDPWQPLDEALALAEPTGELQRRGPVAVARAEAAWLDGDVRREAPLLARVYPVALELGTKWNVGSVAYWLWRAGELDEPPERAAEPFALQMTGRWAEAAARWGEIGCPYERAMALGELDDEASLRESLEVLRHLGAARSAERVIERMRTNGIDPAAPAPDEARPAPL